MNFYAREMIMTTRRPSLTRLLAAAVFLLALGANAQESRGSISGTVTDPQGSMVPAAQVVVVSEATNAQSRTTTNNTGFFEVPLLNPGAYSVTVEAPGFKKTARTGLTLTVGTRLVVDVALEVGQVAETVEVTGEAPLLETRSASGGRIVSTREIAELPVPSMNPFLMAGLASGMQWTGSPSGMQRAFDVGGTTSFNTAGNVGQNEYTIDGAPVTGTERRVGYVPPIDAVGEFKLETSSFDASFGHTSGATINVSSRSGTNQLHGSIFDQHWQNRWNATPHFTRLAYEAQVAAGTKNPNDPKQVSGRSNNFGGTISGPVRIPKILDGRDKLFFLFTYNGYAIDSAGTGARSVPHDSWYNGDFSDIQAIDPVQYTVFDPRSARQDGNRVVRTPFPGNKGIPVLNPVFNAYAKIYPKATNVPGFVTKEGINNHFDPAVGQKDRFKSLLNRNDYFINDSNRLNFKWYWSERQDYTGDWTRETFPGLHDGGGYRRNIGGSVNHNWTINPSNLLDITLSGTRFIEGLRIPVQTAQKPTEFGFPAYIDAKAGAFTTLPRINFSGGLQNFSREYAYEAYRGRGTTIELKLGMNTVMSSHTLKYGWSERRYVQPILNPNNSSGQYTFANTYMRANDVVNTASNYGLDFAAFMMGVPTGITIDTVDSAYWTNRYRALYLQDEWRVSRKLTVSMGMRYERETGMAERFNRGIGAQFYDDIKLPITDLVQAAYARAPLAEMPASSFKVVGGPEYFGARQDRFTKGTHLFLPRAGVAYSIDDKTVLRAGYGLFYDTLNVNNSVRPSQLGYSQPTDTVISNDNGLSFCCGTGAAGNLSASRTPMHDPFPVRANGTRFDMPVSNTLGPMIMAGRSFSSMPWGFVPDQQQRWRIGVQRQFRSDMVLEIAYSGARSRTWNPNRINYLPANFWATGNVRNAAVDNDMNGNVTNPFYLGNLAPLAGSDPALYKYLAGQSLFTSTVVRKNVLLRSFPQMGTLTGMRPGSSLDATRGLNVYRDLQVQFEKRLSRGLQTAVMYTWASGTIQTYMNEFDTSFVDIPSSDMRPHRFVWSGIFEFPFGKGRKWLASNPLRHVVGDWQVSWIYQRQSGPPLVWANRFYYGDVNQIADVARHDAVHSADIHGWFDPAIAYKGSGAIPSGFTGFEGRSGNQPGAYHVRVFPFRLDSMRADGIRNWDIRLMRNFNIYERTRFVLSLDMLNFTNHTNFAAPGVDPTQSTFGRVTSVNGSPRVLQLNMRLEF